MLTSLAYMFLFGLALGGLFSQLRLPALLGMLITGIALGPHALDLIHPSLLNISAELRHIALVIILMRAGLALDINDLKRVGRPAVLMCFLPAACEIIGMMWIAPPLLHVSVLEAALIGAVVAAVSPAVIVPKMLHLMENKIGTRKSIPQMIMAGASVDDVFVIVLFSAFLTLATGGVVTPARFLRIPVSILSGLALGAVMGGLLVMFYRRVHMRDSIKVLILLSTSFLLLAMETRLEGILPMSGLLGIMTMGTAILKYAPPLAERMSLKFSHLWVAAEIILFVMVGATVDLRFVTATGGMAIIAILVALCFRMAGVFCCLYKTRLRPGEKLFCMIAYTPKATVQAAIGSIPLTMGLPCGTMVLTVAVLAILITAPLGAVGIDRTYRPLLIRNRT